MRRLIYVLLVILPDSQFQIAPNAREGIFSCNAAGICNALMGALDFADQRKVRGSMPAYVRRGANGEDDIAANGDPFYGVLIDVDLLDQDWSIAIIEREDERFARIGPDNGMETAVTRERRAAIQGRAVLINKIACSRIE